MAWTLFVLSSLYICEWDIAARYCGQVMNDQQRMEVHSNNLQANPNRSLVRGRKFIIQLSEDFFFIIIFFIWSVISCGFRFIFRFIKVTLSQHSTSVSGAVRQHVYTCLGPKSSGR